MNIACVKKELNISTWSLGKRITLQTVMSIVLLIYPAIDQRFYSVWPMSLDLQKACRILKFITDFSILGLMIVRELRKIPVTLMAIQSSFILSYCRRCRGRLEQLLCQPIWVVNPVTSQVLYTLCGNCSLSAIANRSLNQCNLLP